MHLHAQVRVKVQNSSQEPLVGASVVAQGENESILAYGITDKNGEFVFQKQFPKDSIQLVARYIGYEKTTLTISRNTAKQPILFTLQPNNQTLEDVVVTYDAPIKQRKDTLIYSVDALKDSTDVVLADVIKKMPGVDVDSSGKIYYQGKEINKFYIENSDLLGKQYNLASDNLPVKDVKSIEVYEKHQPIKLLEDKLPTDEAALNIKLKNKITKTLTGKAKIGAKPLLWNGKLSPMFFTKKAQALIVAQSNNTGENSRKYTSAISIEDLGGFQQLSSSRFKTIGSAQYNTLSNDRWRDNKSYLLTPNLLFPLGKDVNLRVNHSTLLDETDYETTEKSTFFTTSELINRILKTNENKNYQKHKTNILIEKNEKKFYFKNALMTTFSKDKLSQYNQQPRNTFLQTAVGNVSDVENKIKLLLPLKNGSIIQLKSELQYQKTTNDLQLPVNSSELLEQLFAQQSPEQLNQFVKDQLFQTNHSISRKFLFKKEVETDVQAGIKTTHSDLRTTTNAELRTGEQLANDFQADLMTAFFNPSFKWDKGILKLRSSMKFSYRTNKLSNQVNNTEKTQTALPFEPSITVILEPNSKWTFTNRGQLRQSFSPFDKRAIGYFINNSQSVSYGGQLEVDDVRSQSFGTAIKYKNIFSALFASANYSVYQTDKNLLNNIQYNSDGSQELRTIYSPNTSFTQAGGVEFGKLFSSIHLNTKAKLRYTKQDGVVLLNNKQEAVKNTSLTAKLSINEKFTDDWIFSLEGKSKFYRNYFRENKRTNKEYFAKSKLTFLPTLTQSFGISNELLHNEQQNITVSFLDAYWRKKLDSRYQLFVEANNVLNANQYQSYQASLNQEYTSTQELRPRQFFVGLQFRIGKKKKSD